MTRINTPKLAYLAAAASLAFAGGAFAQTLPTAPTPPAKPALPPVGAGVPTTAPSATGTAAPTTATTGATSVQTTTGTTPATASTNTATGADTAGMPSSATVAASFSAGSEIKDPSGMVIGVIAGDGAAADGSATVMVTQGEKKFALPRNSLSVGADGAVSTTATKAQIDATLAGAVKPK